MRNKARLIRAGHIYARILLYPVMVLSYGGLAWLFASFLGFDALRFPATSTAGGFIALLIFAITPILCKYMILFAENLEWAYTSGGDEE